MLTDCMKSRVIIVDLKKSFWLKLALNEAKKISKINYKPSNEAYTRFDQVTSMKKMSANYYEL